MILLITEVWPPKIQATKSNLNKSMLPQFKAPIMVKINAILSIIIMQTELYKYNYPLSKYNEFHKSVIQYFYQKNKNNTEINKYFLICVKGEGSISKIFFQFFKCFLFYSADIRAGYPKRPCYFSLSKSRDG